MSKSSGDQTAWPQVSVVIPTHNRKDKLIQLVNSILRCADSEYSVKIIIIDDGSTDGTSEAIKTIFPRVLLSRTDKQVLLAKARNIGLQYVESQYVLFVDDDMIVDRNTVQHLEVFLENNPDFGIVGPVIAYFNDKNRVWTAGSFLRLKDYIEHYTIYSNAFLPDIKRTGFIECSYVPGIFMARKKMMDDIHGFDHLNFPFSYEEIDLAIRARSTGFKTACVLSALAYHDIPEPPVKRGFQPLRIFHHARSRTRFYVKYAKWKLAWLPFYSLGFALTQLLNGQLSLKKRLRLAFSYIKGVIYGIARR